MSHRYLMYISYIGTNFRGIAKNQVIDNSEIKPSVQGAIEAGLTLFRPLNQPKLVLSSRTDAGVHALNSSVHVDLNSRSGFPFSDARVTSKLNRFFHNQNLQIRINKTEIVPDTFHARFSAKRRTYLYRLAIRKQSPVHPPSFYLPIDEVDRCYFIQNSQFDTNLAHEAAELITGTHDFRTFMKLSSENQHNSYRTVRDIESITIEPGESCGNICTKPLADDTYDYYNIRITARSFLYQQVRRIVAVILATAQKLINTRVVYEMLTIPSKHNWRPNIAVAPAHGLYLCQVDYDAKDKELPVKESNFVTDQIEERDENELPQ